MKNTKKFRYSFCLIVIFLIFFLAHSCSINSYEVDVYQTSKDGDNLKLIDHESNKPDQGFAKQINLVVNPNQEFQEIIGFGASFTESSAWNLATIPIAKRQEILDKLFNPEKGAGFSLTRTHINSCDYSNSHYT